MHTGGSAGHAPITESSALLRGLIVSTNQTVPRIIVADDNPVLLQGLDRALSTNGYAVSTANNGVAVLDLLNTITDPPDLLLLDVMMPEMSGLDVLRRVHSDPRWFDLPIVLITAASDAALPIAALNDGAVDFLTKPFRLSELMARVQSHVQRYRELQRVREESVIRVRAMDIVRDLNSVVTVDEMFRLVTRRGSELWGVKRCSVILHDGCQAVRVAASSEQEVGRAFLIDLRSYPEIEAAISSGGPVVIEDVATSPLFDRVRAEWASKGMEPPLHSVVSIPFRAADQSHAVLVIRGTEDEPRVGHETLTAATDIVEAITRALGRAHMFESLVEQRRQLHYLASTDELTGCASRRSLQAFLHDQFRIARSSDAPLSVVILDIDNFKVINDTHGHLAGDSVLRRLGEWLRGDKALRTRDCAGRFGGDEFVVVLPDTGPEGALRFAERARAFVSSGEGEGHIEASLSAGVASWPASGVATADDLLARADAALYHAKQEGRNRVRDGSPHLPSLESVG